MVHVLWECPAYSSCREAFKAMVKEFIGDSFEQLSDIDKTVYVLGSELWEDKGKLGKLGKFHVQVCSGNVHAIVIVVSGQWHFC